MSIEKELLQVDYTSANAPDSVKNFRPDVYRDEHGFYCILGSSPDNRIMGQGETIEKAFASWDAAYQERQRR